MTTTDDLLELERGFWGAAGDADFYREHFLDEGVCVFSMGILDKQATIRGIEDAEPWKDVTFDDVVLVELGADAATLAYSARAHRSDDGIYDVRVSSTYLRLGGRWLLAVHQQTPIG